DDVVVVRVAVAPAVRRLAGGRASYVDVAVVGQGLQRAVDARQPDGGAARPQLGVDVLRRQERRGVGEDNEDGALRLRRHGNASVMPKIIAAPAMVSARVASDG